MKRDSGKGGKRQDQPLRQDHDSARESGASLDTLDSFVLLPRPGNMDTINGNMRRVRHNMTARRLKQQNAKSEVS